MLFYIFEHPITADIILVTPRDAIQPTVVTYHSSAELGNVVFKVNQVLTLLVGDHIVKVDVFVSPLEVMDNSFISQFFLYDEQILEEINNSFVDVEVVKLSYHCLLIFKVFFICVDQAISLVNDTANVVKNLSVHVLFESGQCLVQGRIF